MNTKLLLQPYLLFFLELAGKYFENSLERTIGTDSKQHLMSSNNKISTNPL